MITAGHTDDLRRCHAPPSARILNDHGSQMPAFDTPGIEAFAVLGQLQATAGVVAIDGSGAEAARKTSLVLIPEL